MKIKLVTFAPNRNFGTCLQSYALNKILIDKGHEVEFIYNENETAPLGLKVVVRNIVKKIMPVSIVRKLKIQRSYITSTGNEPPYILRLPNDKFQFYLSKLYLYKILHKFVLTRTLQKKKVYSFTFEDGNYHMKRLYTTKQYKEVVQDADLFITGSDQIWNPYCGGFNPMMFLEFAENKKRIAYSSSIARPYFPNEVVERAKKDLSRFKYIAVREKTSVNMLNELLERNDVQLVVDPTYLLSRDEWKEFGDRAVIEFNLPQKYILCYFIGGRYLEYEEMVEDVKNRTGIKDVITIDCTDGCFNYGNGLLYKDGGPYEFVNLICHATIVCMDSFHATVFSLKFHKDFVHILKTKSEGAATSQNSRMYDLLNRYGLLHKLYDSDSHEWTKPIDYKKIDEIIKDEINKSLEFLDKELNN